MKNLNRDDNDIDKLNKKCLVKEKIYGNNLKQIHKYKY